MGIELSILAEYKDKEGKWNKLKTPDILYKICSDCDDEGKINPDHDCEYCTRYFFLTKNLFLRELLGDDGIYGIDKILRNRTLRGRPLDISEECRDILYIENYFSYLSLRELIEFDWEKTFNFSEEEPNKTYWSSAGDFYSKLIPYLKEVSKDYGGVKNIRIVYGYG